ncbi:MAG: hypothetical protein QOE36_77 [Gaiellaceae bacterium]|jgi:hypothetical protein|nr:hypothetical protein [Gaiellaceae bacterium]MDX6510573.1 hypothetical protein [Gaiellaceae bacterium]
MPTQTTEPGRQQSLGGAVKEVSEHASALLRLEIELAKTELANKVKALGIGIGLGLGALLILLYAIGFGFATAAAALATVVSTWLALLIVFGGLLLLAGLLGALALGSIKKGSPPIPNQAIQEAKVTAEALRSDGGGS